MIDWATWSVEAVGLVILVIWTVLPIQEFRAIARRLRQERAQGAITPARQAAEAGAEPVGQGAREEAE